jgi:hypothetical protein
MTRFGDSRFDDWVTYRQALGALSDTPADPESVVFPTRPSTAEDDTVRRQMIWDWSG